MWFLQATWKSVWNARKVGNSTKSSYTSRLLLQEINTNPYWVGLANCPVHGFLLRYDFGLKTSCRKKEYQTASSFRKLCAWAFVHDRLKNNCGSSCSFHRRCLCQQTYRNKQGHQAEHYAQPSRREEKRKTASKRTGVAFRMHWLLTEPGSPPKTDLWSEQKAIGGGLK